MRVRRRLLGALGVVVIALSLVGVQPHASAASFPLESKVKPDIVLTPHGKRFTKKVLSPMVGGEPLAFTPYECRHNVVATTNCDVYRLKLNLSHKPGAQNLVVISVDYTRLVIPDLNLVATGLSLTGIPDLDIQAYYNADSHINSGNAGGSTLSVPERISWVAQQSEFDIVVLDSLGVSSGYTITAFMTDELFDKPYEALDDTQIALPDASNDTFPDTSLGGFGDGTDLVPSLGLAPIDPDPDISAIGLGTDEQFAAPVDLGGGAARNTTAVSDPPSTLALVLGLGVIPLLIAVLGAGFLRRRRDAII